MNLLDAMVDNARWRKSNGKTGPCHVSAIVGVNDKKSTPILWVSSVDKSISLLPRMSFERVEEDLVVEVGDRAGYSPSFDEVQESAVLAMLTTCAWHSRFFPTRLSEAGARLWYDAGLCKWGAFAAGHESTGSVHDSPFAALEVLEKDLEGRVSSYLDDLVRGLAERLDAARQARIDFESEKRR